MQEVCIIPTNESLKWFCIFPYDVLKLILFACDYKTRHALLQTCKRLFSEIYQYPFQRRWLSIGMEPPPLDLLREDYGKCNMCQAVMMKTTLKSHVCKFAITPNNYCYWCMGAYEKGTKHDKDVCLKRRIKFERCLFCGTWHRNSETRYTCPFWVIECENCVGVVGQHRKRLSHPRALYQACEVCGKFKESGREFRIAKRNICPNALPRCKRHAVHECFGCNELIDPAVQGNVRHVCKLLEHYIQLQLNCRLIKLNESVFVTENGYNSSWLGSGFNNVYHMFVKSPFDIPSLLPWDHVRVCLLENGTPLLVAYSREATTCETGPSFPEKYCATCITTKLGALKWCRCKRVMYCSVDCQKMHWPNHKAWCFAKKK